jgi:hypothetical protein
VPADMGNCERAANSWALATMSGSKSIQTE